MNRLILICLFLCMPMNGFAAAITSSQTGNLSDGSTWVGGVAPGESDTFTILDGHAVTLDTAVTTSGTIAAGGELITASILTLNGTLTASGDVAGKYSKITQNAGSGISAGANNIIIAGGTPNATSGTIWVINGTSGNRVTNTGTTGKIDFVTNGRTGINWQYATFDGFLHATDCNRINGRVGVVGAFSGGETVRHSIFKNAGTWVFGNGNAQELSLAYNIEYNDFRSITIRNTNNPYGSNQPNIAFHLGTSAPSIVPYIRYNTFVMGGVSPKIGVFITGAIVSGNVSQDAWWRSPNTAFTTNGNYMAAHTVQDFLYLALGGNTVSNNVFVSTFANNHGLTPAQGALAAPTTITGNVFYNYESQDNPILIYDNAGDINITNNIFTGSDSYLSTFGNTVTFSGQTIGKSPTINYTNNTVIFTSQKTSDNNTGSAMGIENGNNYNYTTARNNIIYNPKNYQTTGFSDYLVTQRPDDLAEYGYNNFFAPLSTIQNYWNLNVSDWTPSTAPTYASSTTFTLVGDQTTTFINGVRIRLHLGTRLKRCLCTGSTYSAGTGLTTVTIDQSFATASLSAVDYSSGTNYQSPGTGIAGGGDLAANPNFVDPSRSFITFAESKGATGTIVQKITYLTTELLKINGTASDGSVTTPPTWGISDISSYIIAGFTPTNQALKATGYGGVDIGAVAVQSTTTPRKKPSSSFINFNWGFSW